MTYNTWRTVRPIGGTSLVSVGAVVALVLSSATLSLRAQNIEIIDNTPFTAASDAIKAPLIAIRPLADIGAGRADQLGRVQLSKQLLLDSAGEFPEIRDALERANLTLGDIKLAELKSIVQSSAYVDKYLYYPGRLSSDFKFPRLVMSNVAQERAYKLWNATALVNMMVTGVIDVENVHEINVEGIRIDAVRFEPNSGRRVAEIYKRFDTLKIRPIIEVGFQYASLRDEVKQYDPLARSLLLNIGEITFGRQIIYASSEKDLIVPDSILREFDVYWIDLAATFRDMDPEDIDEMAINFATPEGTVALELVPLMVSREFAFTEESGVPEVGIEVHGTAVKVGEFFKRTVAYKHLRPSVVAYGLGERKFSWAVRDEAIRVGSHRFVAIIGVPKGSAGVQIAMSGHVRLKKGFLGGILGEEGIAGTESQTVPISF